jgi:hypothetical protein
MTLLRPAAALALAVGLFLALPGCGDKPKPDGKDNKDSKDPKRVVPGPDDKKEDPKTNPPKPPERIDTKSGVGKDAVDFLTAVGAGNAKACQLSSGFVKLIGVPAELPSDKAKGYSADAAEGWLRRVGAKLTGMGPMAESTLVGDVAIFRGMFTGGTYSLRMVKEGDAWKVDWLSMSSANATTVTVGTPPSADPVLQGFAASAMAAVLCDKDAMPKDDRAAVIAAGMTPALRTSWAEPFGGDKDKGYDYSPAKLGLKIAEIGGGAESVSVSPAGEATFKVEVTKAGGAKSAYTMKLAKGTTPGQWLVESLTPQ